MAGWESAVMAMIAISAAGFLISDGEKRRIHWVRAMRRCLLCMNSLIRYEQPGLVQLLKRVDIRTTPQERALTRMIHSCAEKMDQSPNPQLALLYAGESARLPGYGVLSREDRAAFENVLADLGRTRLPEQLRLIEHADERLRAREELLAREGSMRARLIRTLGVCCGAAAFLIMI